MKLVKWAVHPMVLHFTIISLFIVVSYFVPQVISQLLPFLFPRQFLVESPVPAFPDDLVTGKATVEASLKRLVEWLVVILALLADLEFARP